MSEGPRAFQVRGVQDRYDPSALATIHVPNPETYDNIVKKSTAAALSYLDDDDGMIITVGSGPELYARIDELADLKPVVFDLLASLKGMDGATTAEGIREWLRYVNGQQREFEEDVRVVDATPDEEGEGATEMWSRELEREMEGLLRPAPTQGTGAQGSQPHQPNPVEVLRQAAQSVKWATETALRLGNDAAPAVENVHGVLKGALEALQTHVGRVAAEAAERTREAANVTRSLDLSEVEEGRKQLVKLAEGLSQLAVGAGRVAGEFAGEVGREASAIARRTREEDRAFMQALKDLQKGKEREQEQEQQAQESESEQLAELDPRPVATSPVQRDSAFWQQMDKIASHRTTWTAGESSRNPTVEDVPDDESDRSIRAASYGYIMPSELPEPTEHVQTFYPAPSEPASAPDPEPVELEPFDFEPSDVRPPPHWFNQPDHHHYHHPLPPNPHHRPSSRRPHRAHRPRPTNPHFARFHHMPNHVMRGSGPLHSTHSAADSEHALLSPPPLPRSPMQPPYEFIRPSSVQNLRRTQTAPVVQSPRMSSPQMPGGFPEQHGGFPGQHVVSAEQLEEREKLDRCVAHLMEMGFDSGEVFEVARMCGGDVTSACDVLNEDRCVGREMGMEI